jgi:hypothetical protein
MPLVAWPPALPDIARIRRPVAARAVVTRLPMRAKIPACGWFDSGSLEEV